MTGAPYSDTHTITREVQPEVTRGCASTIIGLSTRTPPSTTKDEGKFQSILSFRQASPTSFSHIKHRWSSSYRHLCQPCMIRRLLARYIRVFYLRSGLLRNDIPRSSSCLEGAKYFFSIALAGLPWTTCESGPATELHLWVSQSS